MRLAFGWLATAAILFGMSLVPPNVGGYAALWWSLFALWSVACVAAAFFDRGATKWIMTWLATLLMFPKRDPNGDFITALNANSHDVIPVVEALLAVFAVAALVATLRHREGGEPPSSIRRPIRIMGYGFILAALVGTVVSVGNLSSMPEFFPLYFNRAIGRILRELAEGCAIVALTRVKWDSDAREQLRQLTRVALVIATIEFMAWVLPVLPGGLHRYLTDFRGGFRSVVHGYAVGLMMAQAWIYLIAVTCLTGSAAALLCSVIVGSAATFISYNRTMFFAVGGTALILGLRRMSPRPSTRLAMIATLALIAAVPARPAIERLSAEASEAKGSTYLSASSLIDRYDIAVTSWNAVKGSVVTGIGQAALPSYVFRILVSGGVLAGNFVYSINDEFEQDVGSRQFDSHDLWISLAVESGVVGLAVVIAYFWVGARVFGEWRRGHKHAFIALVAWTATFASYVAQAEPYILSLTCLVIWVTLTPTSNLTE